MTSFFYREIFSEEISIEGGVDQSTGEFIYRERRTSSSQRVLRLKLFNMDLGKFLKRLAVLLFAWTTFDSSNT